MRLADYLPLRVITCTGTAKEYLRRYFLLRYPGKFGVFLHHFIEPDIPIFHDHPWSFVSIVLRGGYTEIRPGMEPKVRRRGSIAWRKAMDLHYVTDVQPNTWTLICKFRNERAWGFMLGKGWAHHTYVVNNRGAHDPNEAERLKGYMMAILAAEPLRRLRRFELWRRLGVQVGTANLPPLQRLALLLSELKQDGRVLAMDSAPDELVALELTAYVIPSTRGPECGEED